ncbi:MAG: NnrU family protein [Gammaproteobacteria bacterium]
MSLLILGVALWAAVHLFPVLAPARRAALSERLGQRYRGLFSLLILSSLALIVIGWRGTIPALVYPPQVWGRHLTYLLVAVAFVLFAAAKTDNNIKRVVRHPQLTAVLIWGIGHLFANGDIRSLILFGGMGLWAVAEMVLISRREGAWQKPAALPWSKDLVTVVVGLVVMVILMFLHPFFTGMMVIPT